MTNLFIDFNTNYSNRSDRLERDNHKGCELDKISGVKLIPLNDGYKRPKIKIVFKGKGPSSFNNSWDQIIILVRHFFSENYFCGKIIRNGNELIFNEYDENDIECKKIFAKTVEGGSEFHALSCTIRYRSNSSNMLVFIHELVHGLMELNGCNCCYHRECSAKEEGFFCSHLNVFDDGVPGMLLDLKTLVQINYKNEADIVNSEIQFNKYHLPLSALYSNSTEDWCETSSKRKEEREREERERTHLNEKSLPVLDANKDKERIVFPFASTATLFHHSPNVFPSHARHDLILKDLELIQKPGYYKKNIVRFFESKFSDEFDVIDKILGNKFSFHNKKRLYIRKNIDDVTNNFYKKSGKHIAKVIERDTRLLNKILKKYK